MHQNAAGILVGAGTLALGASHKKHIEDTFNHASDGVNVSQTP